MLDLCVRLNVMVMCRETNADVTTTARAAAAAAALLSSPGMLTENVESPADCVTAAFRHQLLAATAVMAARTPGYVAATPGAPAAVRPLPTSSATSVDHHAAGDARHYDSARLKQQLNTGKHFRS